MEIEGSVIYLNRQTVGQCAASELEEKENRRQWDEKQKWGKVKNAMDGGSGESEKYTPLVYSPDRIVVRMDRQCSRRLDHLLLSSYARNISFLFALIPGGGQQISKTIANFNEFSQATYTGDILNITKVDSYSSTCGRLAYILVWGALVLECFYYHERLQCETWAPGNEALASSTERYLLFAFILTMASKTLHTLAEVFENIRLSGVFKEAAGAKARERLKKWERKYCKCCLTVAKLQKQIKNKIVQSDFFKELMNWEVVIYVQEFLHLCRIPLAITMIGLQWLLTAYSVEIKYSDDNIRVSKNTRTIRIPVPSKRITEAASAIDSEDSTSENNASKNNTSKEVEAVPRASDSTKQSASEDDVSSKDGSKEGAQPEEKDEELVMTCFIDQKDDQQVFMVDDHGKSKPIAIIDLPPSWKISVGLTAGMYKKLRVFWDCCVFTTLLTIHLFTCCYSHHQKGR
jgi:hypothetical protein